MWHWIFSSSSVVLINVRIFSPRFVFYIWDVTCEILVRNNAATLTEWNVFVGMLPTRPLRQRVDFGFSTTSRYICLCSLFGVPYFTGRGRSYFPRAERLSHEQEKCLFFLSETLCKKDVFSIYFVCTVSDRRKRHPEEQSSGQPFECLWR